MKNKNHVKIPICKLFPKYIDGDLMCLKDPKYAHLTCETCTALSPYTRNIKTGRFVKGCK